MKKRLRTSNEDTDDPDFDLLFAVTKRSRLSNEITTRHSAVAIMGQRHSAHWQQSFPSTSKPIVDYDDWQRLKDAFCDAATDYEEADVPIEVLRGMIGECERILRIHPDPTVIYEPHHGSTSSQRSGKVYTPPKERLERDFGVEDSPSSTSLSMSARSSDSPSPEPPGLKTPPADLPTTFYMIYGYALSNFGSLLSRDPSLAARNEPQTAVAVYKAALTVFETGYELVSKRDGGAGRRDWKFELSWAGTLFNLAAEKLRFAALAVSHTTTPLSEPDRPHSRSRTPIVEHPLPTGIGSSGYERYLYPSAWSSYSHSPPSGSYLPPYIHRTSHSPALTPAVISDPRQLNLPPLQLLVLARDHLECGLLYVPRRRTQLSAFATPSQTSSAPYDGDAFFAIVCAKSGYRSLSVIERLPEHSQRKEWLDWSDMLFAQAEREAEALGLKWLYAEAVEGRGRCALVKGKGEAEYVMALKVLSEDAASSARSSLKTAISYFDRARETLKGVEDNGVHHRPQWSGSNLIEALLTLADITSDPATHEQLLQRAERERSASVEKLDSAHADMDQTP